MRFLTLIAISICSLSLSVKTHAQIEIFGISFAKSYEEIVEELHRHGYRGAYFDQQGFPAPCVDKRGTIAPECRLAGFYHHSEPFWWEACSSQFKDLKECRIRRDNFNERAPDCPDESNLRDQCYYDHPRSNRAVFLNVEWDANNPENADGSLDSIIFGCGVYRGCSYDRDEVWKFLIDKIGDQLVKSSDGQVEFIYPWVKCAQGIKGEHLCLAGGEIYLGRVYYKPHGMTLSLD